MKVTFEKKKVLLSIFLEYDFLTKRKVLILHEINHLLLINQNLYIDKYLMSQHLVKYHDPKTV